MLICHLLEVNQHQQDQKINKQNEKKGKPRKTLKFTGFYSQIQQQPVGPLDPYNPREINTRQIPTIMGGKTKSPEVIVLFPGYSKLNENHMLANCTCTLIKGPPNIIVDTMTAWDGDKLTEALKNHQLSCDDINFVVNTHCHSDHVGCNYLFQNATHIVGFSVSQRDKYFDHDFKTGHEYIINDRIKVIPTPGHTLQDVTVLVESDSGIYAITGDLFEKEEDLHDDNIWIEAGSDSEELQALNRSKILQLTNYIVPGHGPMFEVPDSN